jgi:hypothetical protein
LTGQGVLARLATGRLPEGADRRREAEEADDDESGAGSVAWHDRHFASFRAAEVSASRCGSWQVMQPIAPSLRV